MTPEIQLMLQRSEQERLRTNQQLAPDEQGRAWWDPSRKFKLTRENASLYDWWHVPGVRSQKEWDDILDKGSVEIHGGRRMVISRPAAQTPTAPRNRRVADQPTPSALAVSANQVREARASLYGNRKSPRRKTIDAAALRQAMPSA